MIYLLLSIGLSSFINLIFRYLKNFDLHLNHVITYNYVACVITSLVLQGSDSVLAQSFWDKKWFPLAASLGVIFIVIFTYMALTAQKIGVSVSATASRMGVIFPVIFGYFFLKESLDLAPFIGIMLGLWSVLWISSKRGRKSKFKAIYFLYPLIIFVGSGFIDTSLNYMERFLLEGNQVIQPTTIIFTFAAATGLLVFSRSIFQESGGRTLRNILAGLALGVPNFFSIFYLLKAINSKAFNSVILFPINNISIVLVSTILSVIIFKEKMSKKNLYGLLLAILAILFISIFNFNYELQLP